MKYDQILRSGIGGSGNTLVRLILAYLLGDSKVVGTHRYVDDLEESITLTSGNVGIILPCRDFRSVIASTIRKRKQSPTKQMIQDTYRIFFTPQYESFHKFRTEYPRQQDILRLMYSRFFNDYDYLLDKLQDFLSITITQQQRDFVKDRFSLQSCKDRITLSQLQNWEEVDEQTRLHGNHIGTGLPESWKTFFDPALHKFVTEMMWAELVEYGYEETGNSA